MLNWVCRYVYIYIYICIYIYIYIYLGGTPNMVLCWMLIWACGFFRDPEWISAFRFSLENHPTGYCQKDTSHKMPATRRLSTRPGFGHTVTVFGS